MHHGLFHHAVGMALETELRHRFLQHCLVGGLVGIMTGRAIPALDGRVHYFLLILGLVAHIAEISALLRQSNRKVIRMLALLIGVLGGLMAHRTGPVLDGIMDKFALPHVGMATRRNA